MTKEFIASEPERAFWKTHDDPTQAAVHLALQWLAFVYPAAELQIDRTLQQASPYADADLSSRWSQFLDEQDVEEHVEALEWLAQTLSLEQVPFLVETCWRLLLVDHELPTHVPLALRILGQVLNISEANIQELGETVYRELLDADEERNRAPLLPVDPRYLDRVEWRLYGHSATQRLTDSASFDKKNNTNKAFFGFVWGSLFGAAVVAALVFGPLQLGRVKVPIMLHDGLLIENADVQPQLQNTEVVAVAPTVATSAAAETNLESSSNAETIVATTVLEPVVEAKPIEPSPLEEPLGAVQTAEPIVAPEQLMLEELALPPTTTNAEPASERVLMAVTASLLNVRAAPTVDSDIVIKLAVGAKVWAYPEQANGLWMMIRVEGLQGYASSRFLEPLNP